MTNPLSLQGMAVNAAQANGVPTDVFLTQIGIESNWNPNATSPSGAMGLGQLMPGTAVSLGVTNPYDPMQNLNAAAKYDAQMYAQTGDWSQAFLAYNVGPTGLQNGATPSAAYQQLASDVANSDAGYSNIFAGSDDTVQPTSSGFFNQFAKTYASAALSPGSLGSTTQNAVNNTTASVVPGIESWLITTLGKVGTAIIAVILGLILIAGAVYVYKS